MAALLKTWLTQTATAAAGPDDSRIPLPSLLNQQAMPVRLKENRELYRTLLEMFIETTPAVISELHRSIEAGDSEKTHFLAHKLKGTAATLGADLLKESATILDNACRQPDHNDKMAELLSDLDNKFAALQTEINIFLAEDNSRPTE